MMENTNPAEQVRYSNYLELDKILEAQHPKSMSLTLPVHDEKLFIIVHQAFELWFLQIIHELDYVIAVFNKDEIDDNSEEMMRIVQRLNRVTKILRHANAQFEILETMEPLDFLEFRGLLGNASGFQSKQFRLIEAKLGLKRKPQEQKHYENKNEPIANGSKLPNKQPEHHYKHTGPGGFTDEEKLDIEKAESELSILDGLKMWLDRAPFFKASFWNEYDLQYPLQANNMNKFISDYFSIYKSMLIDMRDSSISKIEKDSKVDVEQKKENITKIVENYEVGIDQFKKIFLEGDGETVFAPREMTAALFIMLYRHIPILRLPYNLISSLIEIDELMSTWRYNHFLLVKKMIGSKPGTGGSGETAGTKYLFEALQKNNVFTELTFLATYFIERSKLPVLSEQLRIALNFNTNKNEQ